MDNTQILLSEKPTGKLSESHFEIRASAPPTPGPGQVLVRSVLLSLDAANRGLSIDPSHATSTYARIRALVELRLGGERGRQHERLRL